MDTGAATTAALDSAQISAYFSLEFPTDGTQPQWTFYLQRLSISLGRATSHRGTSPTDDDGAESPDIDLGPLKTVSRLHARIEYEEDREHFVLVVVGRNGAWVDGIWAGPGRRVPLGARTQIQIATRKFHFVLPPPLPEPQPDLDVDIVSSPPRPASSPVSDAVNPESEPDGGTNIEPEPEPEPELKSETIVHAPTPKVSKAKVPKVPKQPKPSKTAGAGKAKGKGKGRQLPPGMPMPPKPSITYANLCYLAIKGLGGRASLQEICGWAMDTYDWYAYNEGAGWENSVRHNLSSHRAFLKIAREADERGKGAFWSVDPACEDMFDIHTITADAARSTQPLPSTSVAHGLLQPPQSAHPPPMPVPYYPHIHPSLQPPYQALPSNVHPGFQPLQHPTLQNQQQRPKKIKKTSLPLEPAMSRAPLIRAPKITPPAPTSTVPTTSDTQTTSSNSVLPTPVPSLGTLQQSIPSTNSPTNTLPPPVIRTQPVPHPPRLGVITPPTALPSHPPPSTTRQSPQPNPAPAAPLPSSVFIPIIVAPLPASYIAANPTLSVPQDQENSATSALLATPPIVLHESTLILSPTVFSHLTNEQLADIQKLGVQKALQVLKGYMKVFLKEKIREVKAGKGKKRKKAEGVEGAEGDVSPESAAETSSRVGTRDPLPAVAAPPAAPDVMVN